MVTARLPCRVAGVPRVPGSFRVVITGQQVGGHRDTQLGPVRDVGPAAPLTLIVAGHATFAGSVHLHVGGVDVDDDHPQQGAAPYPRHLGLRITIMPL